MSDPNTNIASTVDNFSGGEHNRNDLAPAIVFLVVLALAAPVLVWRAISRKHRCRELINGGLWFLTRGASMILRAYMSRRQYGQRTLVAELILTSISPLFLINGLVDLWQRHMETKSAYDDNTYLSNNNNVNDNNSYNNNNYNNNNVNGANVNGANGVNNTHHDGVRNTDKEGRVNITWVKIVSAILKLILVVAFAAAIAAGVLLGKDLSTESQRKVIANLLKASYVLALAITVISLIAKLATHKANGRSLKKQMLVYAYTLPLLVLSIYRVVAVFSSYRANSRTLAAFYVALILFEFIAYGILLATSIPNWFRSARDKIHDHHVEKNHRMSDDRSTLPPPPTGAGTAV